MISECAADFGKWNDYNGNSPLISFFNAVSPLSKEVIACINEHTFPISFKKGKFLVSPFHQSDNLFFTVKGVIRGFIKEDGREMTTWIIEENDIVGSIRNLGLKLETEEYLQALEDCTLIAIPKKLIEHLYDTFPETNLIGRIIMEDNYRGAEERAYICRIPSAEKRYKRFAEKHPGLLNRISLKYIASYLGITLETLCRIRARQGKNK